MYNLVFGNQVVFSSCYVLSIEHEQVLTIAKREGFRIWSFLGPEIFFYLLFQTCDFTLFWFSYTVMILGWITVLLVLVWLVNKYGRTLFNCITCNKYGY